MKRILFLIATIATLCLPTGCEKEIMPYRGIEGVYFAVRHGNPIRAASSWPLQPDSEVSFIRYGEEQVTLQLPVMITGPVKDYDRPFVVVVNPDSTTAIEGIHYATPPEEIIIPAGAIQAHIPVQLTRTTDMAEREYTLGLQLLPNEHFGLSFTAFDALPDLNGGIVVPTHNASFHTLHINDFLVQPPVWSGSIQDGNRESGLWGAFTRKKFELFVELFGVTYEEFASTETMPMVRQMVMMRAAATHLISHYNAGTPILEDDGRLMFIDTVPWTSYIGVPYVPGS